MKANFDRLPSPVIMRFDPEMPIDDNENAQNNETNDQLRSENGTDSNDITNDQQNDQIINENDRPRKVFITNNYYKENKKIQTEAYDKNGKVLCECDKMFQKLVFENDLKDLKNKISELEKNLEKKRKIVCFRYLKIYSIL